jgi:putative hemolysin
MPNQEKFIDVNQAILDKSPGMHAVLPQFLINWFKERIVHESYLNEYMRNSDGKRDFEFCKDFLDYSGITVHTVGAENIPLNGGAIFAANHPLGGTDALAIMVSISSYRNDVKFLVNDLLMQLKNLNGLFVGVNLFGATPRENIRRVDELFASDNAVFIFPAGLVSRMTRHKVIRDLDWKKTFISKAKRYKKPIVPVHISGRLSKRFYFVAKLRKFFGIKINLEMLFLVDEILKQKGKSITITYGSPILPESLDRTKTDDEWAYEVKKTVYKLPQ